MKEFQGYPLDAHCECDRLADKDNKPKENLMLEKETFALLVKHVENLLDKNEPINQLVIGALANQEPKPFREAVARAVLWAMTEEIGYPVVPNQNEKGEGFIQTLALTFSILAESDRPAKYDEYSPHYFAELLIEQFCQAYVALSDVAPIDESIPDCPIYIDIPACALLEPSLRTILQNLKPVDFGKYTLNKRFLHLK